MCIRDRKQAVVALVLGCLVMTVSMMVWNYFVTPIFMGMPRAAVAPMIFPIILPFNLITVSYTHLDVYKRQYK